MNNKHSFLLGFVTALVFIFTLLYSVAWALNKQSNPAPDPLEKEKPEQRIYKLEQTQEALLYRMESLEKKADTALDRIYRYNGGMLP